MDSKPGDKYGNLNKINEYTDKASSSKADLIVFPELALTGYMSGSKLFELGEPILGPSTKGIMRKAIDKKIYIVVGMPEIRDGVIYNSAPFFGPEGLVGVYRKHYLPNFTSLAGFKYDEGKYFEAVLDLRIFDTKFGKIGINICYDLWHPEIARIHALQGAWLIINISAARVGLSEWHQLLARARALENIVWFAFVNQIGVQGGTSFGGGTCIVDHLSNIKKQASIGEHGKEEIIEFDIDSSAILKQRLGLPILEDVRPEILREAYEIVTRRRQVARNNVDDAEQNTIPAKFGTEHGVGQ
jgi:predicted amidohydrolase